MIYFKLLDTYDSKNYWLKGVSQTVASKMDTDERKKLLTDTPTNAVLTPYSSGVSYVSVQVTNLFGADTPFLAYMKVSDYVKATTSNDWKDGKYIGLVKLVKNGQECFIAPYFED